MSEELRLGPDQTPVSIALEVHPRGRPTVVVRQPFGKYGDQLVFVDPDEVPKFIEALRPFGPTIVEQIARIDTSEDDFLKKLLAVLHEGRREAGAADRCFEAIRLIQERLARGPVERIAEIR